MSSSRRALFACLIATASVWFATLFADELAKPPSTVVATQGQATVTLGDVDAFAQRIPEKDRAAFFDSPQRIETLITNLLLQKQLAAEARAEGMDRDPAIEAQMKLAADDVLAKASLQHFKANIKLPDLSELAREDYVAHREKYVVPGVLEVKHILISTASRSEDDARAIAEKVANEARAESDRFGDLVEKYSDDPSKATNHGLMIDVVGGKYAPEFVAASKALTKPGQVSSPVKTSFGFHVIKLVKRTADRQRSFDEVKAEIITRLRAEFTDKAIADQTDRLRNKPMQASEEVVASLRNRFGTVVTPASLDAKAAAAEKSAHQ